MSAKATIEHIGSGWIEVFTSAGMKEVVDKAGERIASEAGAHFSYSPATNNRFTVGGFVSSDSQGALEEAENKVLSNAVHA